MQVCCNVASGVCVRTHYVVVRPDLPWCCLVLVFQDSRPGCVCVLQGLVEWYDQETGLSAMTAQSSAAAAAAAGSIGSGSGNAMETAEADAPGTPSRVLDDSRRQQQQAAAGPTPPPAKRGGRGGGRGRGGGSGGGDRGGGGRGGSQSAADGKENTQQDEGEDGVGARLRARRATVGQGA